MKNYRLRAAALLAAVHLFVYPSCALAGNGYKDYLVVKALEQQEEVNTNRWLDVPGRGNTLYYAQTNPLWADMRYEANGASSRRRFGAGGCAPTSAAIAITNMLPLEDLGKIRPYSAQKADGYSITTNAMNPLNMGRNSGIYQVNTAEDFEKYMPLVIGQFAAGNNTKYNVWRVKPRDMETGKGGGTSLGFIGDLCSIYGLTYTRIPGKGNMEWINPIRCGGIGVALVNTQAQPFATGSGHYIAIVGCDEEYLYIMDPQDKTEYKEDKKKVLDVLDGGLIRVKLEDYGKLHVGVVHIVTNAQVNAKLDQMNLEMIAKAY